MRQSDADRRKGLRERGINECDILIVATFRTLDTVQSSREKVMQFRTLVHA